MEELTAAEEKSPKCNCFVKSYLPQQIGSVTSLWVTKGFRTCSDLHLQETEFMSCLFLKTFFSRSQPQFISFYMEFLDNTSGQKYTFIIAFQLHGAGLTKTTHFNKRLEAFSQLPSECILWDLAGRSSPHQLSHGKRLGITMISLGQWAARKSI